MGGGGSGVAGGGWTKAVGTATAFVDATKNGWAGRGAPFHNATACSIGRLHSVAHLMAARDSALVCRTCSVCAKTEDGLGWRLRNASSILRKAVLCGGPRETGGAGAVDTTLVVVADDTVGVVAPRVLPGDG